ncbi:MAG: hypothetical protein K2R98_15845 [Gemmataceae bacterium]|nr:hypothetical protein [Gemmataceae bacterium]
MKSVFAWLAITATSLVIVACVDLPRVQATKPSPPVSADDIQAYEAYRAVVERTAAMVNDNQAQRFSAARGLNVLNVTWEDTGRFKGSSVGPNISDMTIQVQQRDPRTGQYQLTCMPVIRFPNFDDQSADINANKFHLLVGNEKGQSLQRVSLWQFLGNVRKHLSRPESWKGDNTFLLANRDTHVLVSAQACFLPVPKQGIAEFNPVLFNYQSRKGDPAVLTILATREGTSMTVIDNQRDGIAAGQTWGQRLFFNQNGERASFTGQRLSDFQGAIGQTPQAGSQKGLNMVLLIQVPLKQKVQPRTTSFACMPEAACCLDAVVGGSRSDVEAAVIGHGKVQGPFTEIDNLPIERDDRFPIRVTVQFYKATSNGVVTEQDIAEVREQIDKVYAEGDYVGSLVTEGHTGRPTEYDGDKTEDPEFWAQFWARHQANTGYSRQMVCDEFRRVRGENWYPLTERDLANDAESHRFPSLPVIARAVGSVRGIWNGSTAGDRIVYVTLLSMLGFGAVGLVRRGWRRIATAH